MDAVRRCGLKHDNSRSRFTRTLPTLITGNARESPAEAANDRAALRLSHAARFGGILECQRIMIDVSWLRSFFKSEGCAFPDANFV